MKTDLLVIGGSAAGIMAAITAKKHYPEKEITLVRREDKVLIPCGIPYTMATVDGPKNDLIPDTTVTSKGIELIVEEIVDIDKANKIVKLKSGEEISYEKLILATGSKPMKLPIDGIDLENVYSVRKDFDLLNEMRNKLDESKNLVIIGGGFIGVEFADESRKERNINITIVEMMEDVLSLVCDKEFCIKAEEKLKNNGIQVYKKRRVVEIFGDKKVESVKLDNGEEIPADMVIVAAGTVPNIDLAEKAGIKFDKKKGIMVDEYMRSSDPNIFACGDCVEKPSFYGSNFEAARLASIATTEGRVAGANLYELRRKKQPSIGIFSTIIDDLAIGVAGMNKKQADELGIKVITGHAEAINRHPGSMPGAEKIGVNLVFSKYDGVLIGAQVYGGKSIGELINILGLAIEKKMTAEDLATLQVGTHPALTASPIAYQIVNAAEDAVHSLRK
ncbi:MAG: FAD-dependent oxidoreductase [Thermotogota bacterium]|jgi:NADPH-dependent 2,4-dienoyl-CoA reductase/sulfur reductase-like enzyme|nr:FAD-dependent oxidoreductase [Thermotogota bacterium]